MNNVIKALGASFVGLLLAVVSLAASLPDGYSELEYVRGTNTQYVNVGLYLKNTYRVEMVFDISSSATRFDRLLLFGARKNDKSRCFTGFINADKYIELAFENATNDQAKATYRASSSGVTRNKRYYVRSDRTIREIREDGPNGTLLASSTDLIEGEFTGDRLCYLMSCNWNQGWTKMMGRVYSFKITDIEADKVLREFVPCCRASDGVAGFYDISDHSDDPTYKPFYASSGTDDFLPGPIVVADSVNLTKSDSSGKEVKKGYDDSCWTNAAQWSNLLVPQSGFTYYVKRIGNSEAVHMRSPYTNKNDGDTYEFPGDAVYVDQDCSVTLPTHRVSFKKLVMHPGSLLISPATASEATTPNLILDGDIQIPGAWAEPVLLKVHCGRLLRIDGSISGDGILKMVGQDATSSSKGIYYFSANNTEFTGRMIVSENDKMTRPDYAKTNQTLRVGKELNVGGKCPVFEPKALTLERCGTLSIYQVADTLELTADYNRGVYVNGRGRIQTSPDGSYGNSLRLATRLTLNGELRKEGAGTLTLAAAGECEGPSSVDLAEGSLALENARALDGADIVIGEGASVSLKLDVADAYCREYGCRLGTITLPAGATALPISLSVTAVPAELKRQAFSLGILTAPTETVNALRSRLTLPPKPVPGYRLVKTDVRDNGDGTSTYFADFEPNGLVLIFR